MEKDNKKMLITGVSGLLGSNLAYYFREKYDILGVYNAHRVAIKGIHTEKCDLDKSENIKKTLSDFEPNVIIHCASLANVDECEIEKKKAKKINVVATKDIIDEMLDKDVNIIYISSDSVYSGEKGNSAEDDVDPQNYYGLSKYEGEKEVLRHGKSLVLRTNFFGRNIQKNKNSLAEWILKELKAGKTINGFKDAYFSVIYIMEFARIIDAAIEKELVGVYNCGSRDSCSKFEFAKKIADFFLMNQKKIIPISIDDFPLNAKRGKDLSMNVDKIQRTLGTKMPSIDDSIRAFYEDSAETI
jgi:dTDP-4-dehydrorhamnose reductase